MKIKKYRVMVCDLYVDVNAASEEEAKEMLLEQLKDGTDELTLIAWELDACLNE